MLFLLNLFFTTPDNLSPKERIQKKIRLETLQRQYLSKIEYLSAKRLSPNLAMLTCQDAKVSKSIIRERSGNEHYLKECLKYYKKKLKEVRKRIKNNS